MNINSLQERNLSHKDFFEDENRWIVSYGGAGSAKSYSTAQKIIIRIINEKNHKILVVRKVAKTLRVSVFELFKELINTLNPKHFKINKSDMTITHLPSNSMILFFGLDDIEKLKSIQGITSIWIEEASETAQGDILELNRRLRGKTKHYKQIILTFNPISHLHWLKSHFFDDKIKKLSIYKTTYKDNAFIDEEYKQEIEDIKLYDQQQYNVYALGEWGVLNQNIIHHRYDSKRHISTKTIEDFYDLHIGLDFNIGGCVGVVLGEDSQGIANIIDAFCVYDTEAIILHLQDEYKDKQLTLYPDSSGTNRSTNSTRSDIQMLRQADFDCIAPKSNGSTSIRYNTCNRKFKTDTLLVNPITARKVSEALQTHAYNDKGLPEKFHNHEGGAVDDYTDAFGYVVARMYPITNRAPKINITHG